MENSSCISVTVCYARPHYQEVIPLTVTPQTTVLQAIRQSGIADRHPEIDVCENNVGIFGNPVKLDRCLRDHDRIEIYRPLHRSPAEVRRRLADRGR